MHTHTCSSHQRKGMYLSRWNGSEKAMWKRDQRRIRIRKKQHKQIPTIATHAEVEALPNHTYTHTHTQHTNTTFNHSFSSSFALNFLLPLMLLLLLCSVRCRALPTFSILSNSTEPQFDHTLWQMKVFRTNKAM